MASFGWGDVAQDGPRSARHTRRVPGFVRGASSEDYVSQSVASSLIGIGRLVLGHVILIASGFANPSANFKNS